MARPPNQIGSPQPGRNMTRPQVGSPVDPNQPANDPLQAIFGPAQGVPGEEILQAGMAGAQKINREVPEPTEERKALVGRMCSAVKKAKKHWGPSWERMREDQNFAYGYQWSRNKKEKRYQANIALRVISQKVSALYAKNPKAVARRREMLLNTTWDGTQSQLQALVQSAGQAMQGAQQTGQPPDPSVVQPIMQQGMAIAQDATQVMQQEQLLDRVSKTLELLYAYNVQQQLHPFKQLMKMTVRRACTVGVSYIKLGFERVMEQRPDVVAKLSDISERLGTLEQLAADIADGETDPNAAEAEELRLLVQDLEKQQEFVAREGLVFDYPSSFSIIPDTKCIKLRGFLGCDWVAEEYILSPNEVKRIYGVDVGKGYTAYKRPDSSFDITNTGSGMMMLDAQVAKKGDGADAQCCCVWELYNRTDGLVYVMCDGWKDFLREPAGPEVPLSRFWPWFTLTLNEFEHEDEVYPPSDVRLIKDMQLDYNRSRQGMREHRRAARPKTVVSAGALDDEDIGKLESHPDNAILELNGLQPGQKVDELLQPFTGPKIDPNLYEVNPYFEDILRVTGVQEANMGATNSDTATQSQIAEAGRTISMDSNIDDIDDILTHLAKFGGQLLLSNVTEETVKRVIGPGAIWPQLTNQQINDEIWLEVQAGSAGRPNQAIEIANAQKVFPLLMQIPGISPEFLARELLRRLDDNLDINQAFKPMLQSIVAMNTAAKGMMAGGPGAMAPPVGNQGAAPQMQGANGGNNSPQQPGGRPGGAFPPPTPTAASGPDMPAPGMGRLPGPTH